MSNVQKWLLIIAALIVSVSLALYLLVFVPQEHKTQLRKQAITQCQKDQQDTAEKTPELLNQLWPPGGIETCADRLMEQWGYTP